MAPQLTDLKDWFHRDLGRFAGWGSEVMVHRDTGQELFLSFYTDTNRYSIRASFMRDQTNGYLGCGAESRKPLAGETWNRGRDLHDGPFSEETWRKILFDIVSFELVKVSRPRDPVGVHAMPPSLGTVTAVEPAAA